MDIIKEIQALDMQINAIKAQMFDLNNLLDKAYQTKETLIDMHNIKNMENTQSANDKMDVSITNADTVKHISINNNGAEGNLTLGANDELTIQPDGGLHITARKE